MGIRLGFGYILAIPLGLGLHGVWFAYAFDLVIRGAIALPAKDLANHLDTLNKSKTYVVYDWTGGTTLGKTALLILLSAGFEAYELSGAMEGWKGMNLPVETL